MGLVLHYKNGIPAYVSGKLQIDDTKNDHENFFLPKKPEVDSLGAITHLNTQVHSVMIEHISAAACVQRTAHI
jgi:hypothetical protein